MVVARRTYSTDAADLWNALTDPERLPRWFAPVHGDLRLGGRFQVEGNAGGVVERCEEPHLFAITWEMGQGASWVTVTLTEEAGGTTLELSHEAVADDPAALEFWAQFGPGAVGVGWDLSLLGLGLHVDSGEPVDPEVAMGLAFSPEGRAFIEHAATDWGRAAAADEAAQRTFAFYTTDPSADAEQPE